MGHRTGRTPRRRAGGDRGVTLIELMLATSVAATLAATAIPVGLRFLDEYRTRAAAHYVAQRLGQARIDAIRRSTFVGLEFKDGPDDYLFAAVADGNHNGLRTTDITSGIDRAVTALERLAWNFPGVTFGLLPGIPDADGQPVDSCDGVRVGTSKILSMNPNGSSSSGTLYIRGLRGSQHAVRVLGATGRIRMLRYSAQSARWIDE